MKLMYCSLMNLIGLRPTSNSRFTPRETTYLVLPQVEELIRASKVAAYFSSMTNQIVRPGEIGSAKYIKDVALRNNCKIFEYELEVQFRCLGSAGFVNWVDNTLEIRETANIIWDETKSLIFEFSVVLRNSRTQ